MDATAQDEKAAGEAASVPEGMAGQDQPRIDVLDIGRIMHAIPHRYPMLLIDRMVDVVPHISAVGVKNVSANEPFFQGHFPGHPVMPGVLIIESMAQTAAVLVVESLGLESAGKVVYFMTIEGAKFRRPVVPGDQLRIHVTRERRRGNVWKFSGIARVDGVSVAEATYSAMIMDHAPGPAIDPVPTCETAGPAVHPTALVAPGARLASDVQVGPWCIVGPDVVLEQGVRLISHVVVEGDTTIGAHAVVYPFCTVGMAPQDLKYRGEPTRTVIGARTQLREHCTVHRGTVTGSGVTRVGADCLLMAVVHVAHDCELGDGVIVANNVVMGGHVSIGAGAVIGGATALHQFVRIGRAAMVGGASGVEADVIPFGTVLGNRARLTGLNVVGLKRRGVDRAGLHRLRLAFRLLFTGEDEGGRVFARRLEEARGMADDPLVEELLTFIDAPSRRGLVRSVAATDEGS